MSGTAQGFGGSGWAFPIGLAADGSIAPTADSNQAIRDSIWMILSTAPGERVMRPDFGCGIGDHVFGVNDPGTASAITQAVHDALSSWEPRIDVLDVRTDLDPADQNLLLVDISYRIRSSNSRLNLVYPFYLE